MTMNSQDVKSATGQVSPGGVTFAVGGLLSISAILTFLVGVLAPSADDLVVTGPGYEYTFQMSGWGWVNILTGMVLALTAVGLFLSVTWARAVAIVVTCLAVVVTFLWMPYYPVGSAVLIALDLIVVWGVATWNTSGKSA